MFLTYAVYARDCKEKKSTKLWLTDRDADSHNHQEQNLRSGVFGNAVL